MGTLLVAMILIMAGPGSGGETYLSREILFAPWGQQPGEFGLLEQAEGVGPQSLSLDAAGNVYVLDLVNRRVQIFGPRGEFLGHTACGILAHDLSVGSQGELFLLAPYHGLVEKYDAQGDLQDRWPISQDIWLIDGMRVTNGQVFLRTVMQTEYSITGAKGALEPAAQLNSLRQGFGGADPARRYRTQWKGEHRGSLLYLDQNGQQILDVEVTTPEMLGSLVFLGTDGEGNVYLRAEILEPEQSSRLNIYKFDPQGTLLAKLAISSSDYTFIYRSLYLDQNGDLYQLLTGTDGVRVLQWSRTSGPGEDQ